MSTPASMNAACVTHYSYMRFPKNMLEKHNLPLLFFEHEYLSNCKSCILEILAVHEKHCILVNCVSEFIFRPWFIFYDKKWETFI